MYNILHPGPISPNNEPVESRFFFVNESHTAKSKTVGRCCIIRLIYKHEISIKETEHFRMYVIIV